jgi:hypothetical protein
VPGAKVTIVAPMSKGTPIKLPGKCSVERIIGICFMARGNRTLAQCDGNFTTKTQRTRSCLGSHLKIQVIEDPLWGLCYNIE